MITLFQHKIKIANDVLTKLLNENEKRALFVYLFSLRAANERRFVGINLKEILNYLGLKSVNSNKKTLIESFELLDSMGLLNVFSSYDCNEVIDWENNNINQMFYIKVNPVEIETEFTLIDDNVIDDIIYNTNFSSNEDALAIVALVSRMIERRDSIYKVCYPSLDTMIKELKIAKSRCIALLKELSFENIIVYEKVIIRHEHKDTTEHNIYALKQDEKDLKAFVNIVSKENNFNRSLKTINFKNHLSTTQKEGFRMHDIWIQDDGTYGFSKLAEIILKAMGTPIADKNQFHNDYFYHNLNEWLYDYPFNYVFDYIDSVIYDASIYNPIGYLIKMLPMAMEEKIRNIS